MRVCYSCGDTSETSKFPGTRKPARRRDFCCDCAGEPKAELRMPHVIITRRAYRAALRYRRTLPQGDLVDLVVEAPKLRGTQGP